MSRTLVVTNDFPTRQGGIESFIRSLADQLPPDEVVIYTASMSEDDEAYDAALPYPVLRDPARTLLPTRKVTEYAVDAFRAYGCDRVLFGAAAPLGMMAPAFREAGAKRIVGITHGHECWWARTPGARRVLRRIGDETDVLTYLGTYTRSVIAPALSPAAAERMARLTPGVDPGTFRPGAGGLEVRRRFGIPPGAPVVVCVARLVARKGQDVLVEALPQVLDQVADARLLLVGGGPEGSSLRRRAERLGVADRVVLAGPRPWSETPAFYDAGDVFAMPCRTRLGGLEPEAFGIVFLEAQAAALPVVVGDSGGAPDTVQHGTTGYVVNPRDVHGLAATLAGLLADPERARAMGTAGRGWVQDAWTWGRVGERLRSLLAT